MNFDFATPLLDSKLKTINIEHDNINLLDSLKCLSVMM